MASVKNARVMRWAMSLQEYDFRVEHIKGTLNETADTLSRHISEETPEAEEDDGLTRLFDGIEYRNLEIKSVGSSPVSLQEKKICVITREKWKDAQEASEWIHDYQQRFPEQCKQIADLWY